MDKVMNKKEVADRMQISIRQVDYLREKDRLPCVKIGRSVRFRSEDVERYLMERLVVPMEKKNP